MELTDTHVITKMDSITMATVVSASGIETNSALSYPDVDNEAALCGMEADILHLPLMTNDGCLENSHGGVCKWD